MSKLNKLLTKEWFKVNYIEKGLTMKQCAELADCGMSTIRRYMKRFGVQGSRSQYEAQTLNKENTGDYRDKDWLYQKYIVEKKNTTELSEICKAGKTTIKRWLKKHGVEVRSNSESHVGVKRSTSSRLKQSESITGKKNHFFGKEHSESTLHTMSEIRALNPTFGGTRAKWYWHTKKNGGVIKLQGTWELETARYLDVYHVPYFVHGEFSSLIYRKNGRKRSYAPDFFLPEQDIYLEIKGFMSDNDREKMQLVKEQTDINLEVWMEKDLVELGILPKGYKNLVAEGYYKDYLVHPSD